MLSNINSQKKYKIRRIKIYCWLGISGLFAILIFYCLAVSEIFKIKIEIIGLQRLSESNLRQNLAGVIFKKSWNRFFGLNNYLVWPKKIDINEPLIANLNIQKEIFKKKVILSIEERQPYGIWCVKQSCYWFDKEGVIFEKAPFSQGSLILIVNSDAEKLPILGKTSLEKELYANIQRIFEFFSQSNLLIQNYSVKNEFQEVEVNISQGPKIFFSLRFNPKTSLEALQSLIQKGLKGIKYIDLTVENRVYVKPF